MPSTPLQGGTSTKVPTRVGAPKLRNSLPNPPEFVVRQRDSHVHVEEGETTCRNAFQERSVHVQQAAVTTPEPEKRAFYFVGRVKPAFEKGSAQGSACWCTPPLHLSDLIIQVMAASEGPVNGVCCT